MVIILNRNFITTNLSVILCKYTLQRVNIHTPRQQLTMEAVDISLYYALRLKSLINYIRPLI